MAGVRKLCEHLTLAAEARQDLAAGEAGTHQLHRCALGEAAIDPFRRPHLAHAASAQALADLPGTEALGGGRLVLCHELVGEQPAAGNLRHLAAQQLDRSAVGGVERQELLDLEGERGVAGGDLRQAGGAPGGVEVAERREVTRAQLCGRLGLSHRSAAGRPLPWWPSSPRPPRPPTPRGARGEPD